MERSINKISYNSQVEDKEIIEKHEIPRVNDYQIKMQLINKNVCLKNIFLEKPASILIIDNCCQNIFNFK